MASKSSFFSDTGISPTLGPVSVNIPIPSVSFAGDFIRINLAGSGYEVQTVAQVAADITPQVVSDIGLPVIGGNALEYIRINAGATAYEARTTAQTRTDLGLGNVAVEAIGAGLTDDGAGNLTATIHGECQFKFVDSTHCKLVPYNGGRIRISGKVFILPSAGVTTDTTGLAASTLYYAYLFNNAGTLTLEFSTTVPVADSTTGNIGIQIKTGDNTRSLVGMVKTDGSINFNDSVSNRSVASWFNRRDRSLSGASTAGATTASTTFVELTTVARVTYLSWGDESTVLTVYGEASDSGASVLIALGIGIDTFTSSALTANANPNAQNAANAASALSGSGSFTSSVGQHIASPVGNVASGTGTFFVSISGIARI